MVFESTNKFPSKETDIGKIPPPASAYGFSKLIGEWYCQAFQKEFGLNYSICRPFNAYGINEAPGKEVGYAHVIPDLTKKMLSGQYPIELLGDGQQTRCFTHVRDLANGIIAVMESKKAINQDFNISNPEETVILDLAKIIWKLIGKKQAFRAKFVPSFTHDVKRRVPNPGKMKRLLNWEAKIRLEKGLPEVINWIKKKLQ